MARNGQLAGEREQESVIKEILLINFCARDKFFSRTRSFARTQRIHTVGVPTPQRSNSTRKARPQGFLQLG